MTQRRSSKKVANRLMAMSSAAILAVYGAGYTRTRSAARRLEAMAEMRRPAPVAESPLAPAPVAVAAPAPAAPEPPRKERAAKSVDEAPSPPEAPPETPSPVPAPAPTPVEPSAPTPAPAPVAEPPAAPTWKDGTYYGWGSSRHGDIQAAVVIEGGRIASASIAQCYTRYSCSVIDRLPPEVAQRQSPEVDYVSGATQSANAFYYAVVQALSKAK